MPKLAAGFVVFRRQDTGGYEFFLTRRQKKNYYIPPKGHYDSMKHKDSTGIIDVAWIDMKEQFGFDKEDLKLYEDDSVPSKFPIVNTWDTRNQRNKVINYWLVELINKKKDVIQPTYTQYKKLKVGARPLYAKDHKWVGLEEAISLTKFKEMRDLLTECDSYINSKILPAKNTF